MRVPFAGIIDGVEERQAVMTAIDSGWHGPGILSEAFEQEFAEYVGSKYCLMTNSGSSANLLSLAVLKEEGVLDPGAGVITSGCGFPATLNPIIHLGFRPILVDYSLATQNINLDQIEKAAAENPDAQAIIFAHTLGIPVDMVWLTAIAEKYGLFVIEDCCEAAVSQQHGRSVGTFGQLGTFSWYPSHQMNGLGGGGCIVTDDLDFATTLRSLRNWGKLAKGPSFAGDHVTDYSNKVDGILYDDQYTYKTIGYNLQPTDIQAAYLREQLKRLPDFIQRRKENWEYLRANIDQPWLFAPEIPHGAEPSYFGYSLVLNCEGERDQFSKYLESRGVRGRPWFAGNITRHNPYKHLREDLPVADFLMQNALFIGVWPGLTLEQMEYVAAQINEYTPSSKPFGSALLSEIAKFLENYF